MAQDTMRKTNKIDKARPAYRAVLYLLWIIIPLIITDSILIFLLVRSEKADAQYGYESSAEAMEFLLKSNIDYAVSMSQNITLSSVVNDFLEKQYRDNNEYYLAYQTISGNAYLKSLYNIYHTSMEIYADNDTLVSGGGIYPLSKARQKGWYKQFIASGKDDMLLFYYDTDDSPASKPKRRMLYIHRMRYYQHGKVEKVIRLDMDYATMARNFESLGINKDTFLCQNGKVSISAGGQNNVFEDFAAADYDKVAYSREFSYGGGDFTVNVLRDADSFFNRIRDNIWYLLFIVVLNAIFPVIYMRLTQSVQKARLEQQETDIARQNAELLALHSQINPHFLFNALESIRMHSVLRGEEETAEMVQKLAVIERKNADWNEDKITVSNEMEFVDAYLKLQQYRFGDRLSYEIDVEEGCENIRLPRLSIVTFVENACVHGIEGKSKPGWIFVRVYTDKDELVLEVEDTGEGISDEELAVLKDKMENASIEKLKGKGRIGVVNACLRLKIATKGTVRFEVESEKNIGTTISVHIPRSVLFDNEFPEAE